MKKILVTGGAGYIGSHTVVELVKAGYEPIIMDNFDNSYPFVITRLEELTGQEIKFYNLSCNNYHDLSRFFREEKEIDGVIHFAAHKAVGESVQDPFKYYNNNVGGLLKLLESMLQNDVKNIVFSSSCTVYGDPDEARVSESTPRKKAQSPYGNTKMICEDILSDFIASENSFAGVFLRYFNPIGAHDSSRIGELPIGTPNNLVPYITQTAIGKRDQLTVFGDTYNTPDGSCIRDYIHVVDLAKAHVKALDFIQKNPAGKCEIFNLGVGKGVSVFEVVKAFENTTNQKLNYKVGPIREGDVPAVFADPTKAEKELGWKAEKDINQALLDSWNWEKAIENEKF
ncbi:UDP-glucose 4-epimerase GalE [Cyclobacteriaceae bacterium]|nr:UDP-glucose 4-epimerase GalE [Cyclobacteriaceae bacterium]